MKFTCLPERLSAAVALTSKVATGLVNAPASHNLALQAYDDVLTLSAVGEGKRVDLTVPAKIEAEGAYTVEPARLASFLAICDDGVPLTAVLDTRLTLVCGKASARLAGMGFDEFPEGQSVEGGPWLRLPAKTLARGLKCVLHATADDDSRPVLAGVEFKLRSGTLTLSAADGFCVATWSVDAVEGDDLTTVVAARRLAQMAASLTYDEPVTLDVSANGNLTRWTFGDAVWTLGVTDGAMPDLTRFFTPPLRATVTYDRQELMRALKFCADIDRNTTGKGHIRRALLAIGYDGTNLLAEDTISDHRGSIDIPSVVESGEPATTSLNAVLLRNALDVLTGERVALEIPEANGTTARAIVAREVGPRNGQLHAIVQLYDKRTEVVS